jgi:hypothetical protein
MTAASGSGLIRPIKPLKHVWQIFGSDALSGIPDGQDRKPILQAGSHPDLAVIFVELDGVAQQVGGNLAQAMGITGNQGRFQVARYMQTTPIC